MDEEVRQADAVQTFLRSVRASRDETARHGPVPSGEVAQRGEEAIARGLEQRERERRTIPDAKRR